MISFRLFSVMDGQMVGKWMADPDYLKFFRYTSVLPTYEECGNYPSWSQNLVMMVMDENLNTIGMAVAYQVNYRNRNVKAGLLIDKQFQKKHMGYEAMAQWIDYLFNRYGFRKVIVENVDEFLTAPYLNAGFQIEGRHIAECFIDGKWVDEIRMACFAEDWKRKDLGAT